MLRLLFTLAVAFTDLSDGYGVLPDDSLNASVGGSVMFTTNLSPTETPFESISWHYGVNPIVHSGTENLTGHGYEGRITLFMSTGSLELRNLRLDDSGEYSVNIKPAGAFGIIGRTTMKIYEPVSNITVSPLSADLIEFNNSVSLSCSSSGSSLSFLWMNGSSEVTASDRVQITDEGSNLTIVNVTRYDQGSYMCNVSNPASSELSHPVNITVSYGPDNVQIEMNPSGEHHRTGANISLTCSTDSSPSATFLWFLNEDQQPDTGSELRLVNAQMSQSGNYSCQAFNSKTLRYQTSLPSAIRVHEPVSNIKVTPDVIDLNEFKGPISFICSSAGSSLFFRWLNSSSEVTASDAVQITDEMLKSSLTILNVTRYDQGAYSCNVSNPVSSAASEAVNLIVNYGPEKVNLNSPSQKYEEGSNIELSCSADSRPPATFQWLLNGTLLPDVGSELKLSTVRRNMSGSYSCRAFNSKTSIYQTSQLALIVIVGRGLSPGAIAGIVIACLVGTSVIVFAVFCMLKKKKPWGKTSNRNITTSTDGNRRDNAANGNEGLFYADVKFSRKKKNGPAQGGQENLSSVYADIRVNNNPS